MMMASITHLMITSPLNWLPHGSIAGVWALRSPVASDAFCNMVVNNTNAVSDATYAQLPISVITGSNAAAKAGGINERDAVIINPVAKNVTGTVKNQPHWPKYISTSVPMTPLSTNIKFCA